jgi:hypothetical protein
MHAASIRTASRRRAGFAAAFVAVSLAACGGGGGGDPVGPPADPPAAGAPPASPPASPPPPAPPPAATDLVDEAALRACPSATSLIQTLDWPTCLAGRRVAGTEPFTNVPCELRFGQNGAFEYLRSGSVFLTVPPRPTWTGGSGLYQNTTRATVGPRLVLASISPTFPIVVGQPWVGSIDVSFVAGATQSETVEVEYFDASRNRTTATCSVNVLP